jgi:hypothetical protein
MTSLAVLVVGTIALGLFLGLIIAFLKLNDRVKEQLEASDSHARSMRIRSVVWPVIVLVAGAGLAFSLTFAPRGGIGARGIVAIMGVSALLAVVLNQVYRWRALAGPPAKWEAARPRPPSVLWAICLISAAIVFFTSKPRAHRGGHSSTGWLLLIVLGAPLLLLLLLLGWVLLRNYDPAVSRALKRAGEGDLDGAIDDLRHVIDERGLTGIRANGLGALLVQKEDWGEAEALFRKALAQRPGDLIVRANLGVALWKSGRFDEAEPVLRAAAETRPPQAIRLCNYANLLIDLGRYEEAEALLPQAERTLSGVIWPAGARAIIEGEIAACRDRLRNVAGWKEAKGLAEL